MHKYLPEEYLLHQYVKHTPDGVKWVPYPDNENLFFVFHPLDKILAGVSIIWAKRSNSQERRSEGGENGS